MSIESNKGAKKASPNTNLEAVWLKSDQPEWITSLAKFTYSTTRLVCLCSAKFIILNLFTFDHAHTWDDPSFTFTNVHYKFPQIQKLQDSLHIALVNFRLVSVEFILTSSSVIIEPNQTFFIHNNSKKVRSHFQFVEKQIITQKRTTNRHKNYKSKCSCLFNHP